jgi:hypothetical protein
MVPQGRTLSDPQVRRDYSSARTKHGTVSGRCLKCGYHDQMPVTFEKEPWYSHWYVILPLILVGVGLIFLALLVLGAVANTKRVAVCPSCGYVAGWY